jgi:hypothetical protein
MSINNIYKYRKAKKMVPDLTQALIETDNAIHAFKDLRRYIPVQNILEALEDNRVVLYNHLKEQTKILDNKGEE